MAVSCFCPYCEAMPWKRGAVSLCYCGMTDSSTHYTAPDEPKQLTPVDVMLPGIALTRTARIVRDYRQGKLKRVRNRV